MRKQESLVYVIQDLVMDINRLGGCAFVNNQGHVSSLDITISESKENWENYVWKMNHIYYGVNYSSSVEVFEEAIQVLQQEKERLLKLNETN